MIDVIGQSSRRDWKKGCGYHRRSLAETLMYRLKVLAGRNLAARTIGAQATEVAIRVGVLNRMTYHRLSLVKTKMRCFKLLGERVTARDFDRDVVELQVCAAPLNRLTRIGIPTAVAMT